LIFCGTVVVCSDIILICIFPTSALASTVQEVW
jgi:hypothetical protein